MADAILMSGGVGGMSSDDVTASRAQVLQGYTALTSDSNDEPIQGSMVNRGNGMETIEVVDAHWENKFAFRMEEGYYAQVGQYKPYVSVPYAVLANGIHLDASKMLDTLQVSGVRGTIPIRGYRGPDSSEMWLYPAEGGYVVRLEEGYYHKDGSGQWRPYVIAPTALVKSAVNYYPEATLSNTTTCGEQGQVKMINTQDSNYRLNKSTTFGIDNWSDLTNPVFYIDFPHGNGYYHRADGNPHTCIDAMHLGDATADKVVVGSTFTSKNGVAVQGQIVDRGDGAVVSYLQGREDWANRIWVLFKNGWYHREPYNDGQGHIHEAFVYVTYEQLKNLFGIDANQMLKGYGIAGVQGAISRWICTTGDVITALNGEGFVWDDTHASRGRGIVVKIPNGHFIQGANWVFLPSPNLYPQNIVKGVSINGVTGTRDWVETFSPTWVSDSTLNLQVNTIEHEVHFPNKLLQYNGLFLKVVIWNAVTDGYFSNTHGGISPCVLSVANWDGGAPFTVKVGSYLFYGILERQGNGFNDFKLRYYGTSNFNVSLNFLATQGFSHQWAGNYAT